MPRLRGEAIQGGADVSGKFQVGDKCIILPPSSGFASCPELEVFTGKTVTLVKFWGTPPFNNPSPVREWNDFWETDIDHLGEPLFVAERRLQKLPPNKREPVGRWEDCPWKPEVLVTTSGEEVV